MGNRKKKDKPVFRVIFNGPYVPTDPEEVCMTYLGMDVDTFIRKIRAGEYDHILHKQHPEGQQHGESDIDNIIADAPSHQTANGIAGR